MRSISTKRSLPALTGVMLGGIGGLASLCYLCGLLERSAYFETLQSGWLIGDISTVELLRSGYPALLPLLFLIGIAAIDVRLDRDADRFLKRISGIQVLGAITFALLDHLTDTMLVTSLRAAFAGFAAAFAMGASICLGKLALEHFAPDSSLYGDRPILAAQEPRDLLRVIQPAHAAFAVSLTALLLVPGMFGRAKALSNFGSPMETLPIATISARNGLSKHPVILVTNERVYCAIIVDSVPPRVTVLPIPWEQIISIAGTHMR